MNHFNQYINNIDRVEFTITNSCTSKCKHCSVSESKGIEKIDSTRSTDSLMELSKTYHIESVMTFGGEPLLFSDTTCAIHTKAKECGIPIRQIITNGCFAKDDAKMIKVANMLAESGVNDIMVSVDCFHAEYLPLEQVYKFVKVLQEVYKEKLRLHPAWVVNENHDNAYNRKTKECLAYFANLHIEKSNGNNIFPSGNAIKYLSSYYEKQPIDMNFKCGQAPYTAELDKIHEIAINPNGDVIACSFHIGNIMKQNIIDILKNYNPYDNPYTAALLKGGICELIKTAKEGGIVIDIPKYYSPCDICHDIVRKLQIK